MTEIVYENKEPPSYHEPSPQNSEQTFQSKKRLVIGISVLLLVVITIVGIGNFRKAEPKSEIVEPTRVSQSSEATPIPEVEPTPFPFQEMTIPFLRRQSFSSSLGNRTILSDSANYTSYITSYLSDGLRINGLLTIPKGEMPEGGWPAVVFVHGYIPPSQYRTTQKYEDYVNYLAKNGLVVFKIDLRGHGSSEGEPGGGYYAGDYVIDTLHARAALQATDFVHPERIGLWGHSMAGNVVMRAMAAKPEIKAIVIWAGAVYSYQDFREYGISDSSYQRPPSDPRNQSRRQQLFNTYGQFDPESEFWRQVAPTNYLEDLNGAIEIHHARNDDVVSIEYSRNLSRLLTNAGVEHNLYEYRSGGHNLSGGSFTEAMQRTVEFYKQNL